MPKKESKIPPTPTIQRRESQSQNQLVQPIKSECVRGAKDGQRRQGKKAKDHQRQSSSAKRTSSKAQPVPANQKRVCNPQGKDRRRCQGKKTRCHQRQPASAVRTSPKIQLVQPVMNECVKESTLPEVRYLNNEGGGMRRRDGNEYDFD